MDKGTLLGREIRQIAERDHQAAMEAFFEFISNQSPNQQQIAFVHKIIHYIGQNGYMADVADLLEPPLDKPYSFGKRFDVRQQKEPIDTIQSITENAAKIAA